MKKSILKIHKKFLELLNGKQWKKILQIYSFSSPDSFIKKIIEKLNDTYFFLNISKYEFLNPEEESEYHLYNGYISGNFDDYKLITVSFTTILGKEGNTFLSQQIMPMITSKLKKENNQEFLLDDRIKKICILTTHKSNKFTIEDNKISETGMSNIQMSVKYINTIGFDVVDLIRIRNLNTHSKYDILDELIDNSNYLQNKNPNNSQFKQIRKEKKSDEYFAEFGSTPKGQEIKFFALKLYAAIILKKGENINISKALTQTNDKTLQKMQDFIEFLKKENLTKYSIFKKNIEEQEEIEFENIKIQPRIREKLKIDEIYVAPYEREPEIFWSVKGKKKFKRKRFFLKDFPEISEYKCVFHDKKHLYFISAATEKNYVEKHHIIPMEFQDKYWTDKKRNLDCVTNLIFLCPHCHNKIHKAIKKQRIEIITKIFNKYEEKLKKIDKDISRDKLAELYNVYIF